MKCLGRCLIVLIGLLTAEREGFAQYRSTASQLRDLEARFDAFLQLQENLLPTLERMNSRLEAVEQRLQSMAVPGQQYAAHSEIVELKRRLHRFEQSYQNVRHRQGWGPGDMAPVQCEYDILTSRLNVIESRVNGLVEDRTSAYQSDRNSAYQAHIRPAIHRSYSQAATSSAFNGYEPAQTIRITIEIHVSPNNGGGTQVVRIVQ